MSAPQFRAGPWAAEADEDDATLFFVTAANGRCLLADYLTEPTANLIAAAPCMAAFVEKHALAGDLEALKLWERINGPA